VPLLKHAMWLSPLYPQSDYGNAIYMTSENHKQLLNKWTADTTIINDNAAKNYGKLLDMVVWEMHFYIQLFCCIISMASIYTGETYICIVHTQMHRETCSLGV